MHSVMQTPSNFASMQQHLTSTLLEFVQRLAPPDRNTVTFDFALLVHLFPGVIVFPPAFFAHQQPQWIANKYNKVLGI